MIDLLQLPEISPPTLQLSPSLHIQQPHARLPEAPCSPLWSLPWAATQWHILPQTQLRWGFVPSPLCIFHLWLSLPMPPKHSESMSSQNILQESPSSLPEQQHYNDKPQSCDAQRSASLLWTRPLGAHSRDPVSMFVVMSCCLANYRQHRIHSFSGHLYCQIRPVCTPREPQTLQRTLPPSEWLFICILCFLSLSQCGPKYHFWKIIFKWFWNSSSKSDRWWCCWQTTQKTLVIRNDVAPPTLQGPSQVFGDCTLFQSLIKKDVFLFCTCWGFQVRWSHTGIWLVLWHSTLWNGRLQIFVNSFIILNTSFQNSWVDSILVQWNSWFVNLGSFRSKTHLTSIQTGWDNLRGTLLTLAGKNNPYNLLRL